MKEYGKYVHLSGIGGLAENIPQYNRIRLCDYHFVFKVVYQL